MSPHDNDARSVPSVRPSRDDCCKGSCDPCVSSTCTTTRSIAIDRTCKHGRNDKPGERKLCRDRAARKRQFTSNSRPFFIRPFACVPQPISLTLRLIDFSPRHFVTPSLVGTKTEPQVTGITQLHFQSKLLERHRVNVLRSGYISSIGCAAAAAFLFSLTAHAQQVGAKYASRNPHNCASRSAPESGAISAAQAKQYFQCDSEKEVAYSSGSSTLTLVTNVSVQVGGGRPFMMRNDATGDNTNDGIDPHFTVYPIRGSFVNWSCSPLSSYGVEPGKNCIRQAMPHATGICFMSSFHEWHCHMQDISQPMQSNQPAPRTD